MNIKEVCPICKEELKQFYYIEKIKDKKIVTHKECLKCNKEFKFSYDIILSEFKEL